FVESGKRRGAFGDGSWVIHGLGCEAVGLGGDARAAAKPNPNASASGGAIVSPSPQAAPRPRTGGGKVRISPVAVPAESCTEDESYKYFSSLVTKCSKLQLQRRMS
ncbi:hypothetical protein TeGR_g14918, partial [Tetraparma gracilis]